MAIHILIKIGMFFTEVHQGYLRDLCLLFFEIEKGFILAHHNVDIFFIFVEIYD
jgi:hypothetical protein